MPPTEPRSADIRILFDGEVVAEIVLAEVQDTLPWCQGTLVEGPHLAPWRDFVRAYHEADLDLDYCPHHPDEGSLEETELAEYIGRLGDLLVVRGAGDAVSGTSDDPWLAPWVDQPVDRLEHYLRFLDHRRWRAETVSGELVVGIPLPPNLDLDFMRFSFRP